MADNNKEEFRGLTKTMADGFKSLVAASKERAAEEARERAKNSDEVKFAIMEQGTRQRKLQEQGLSAEEARYQAQKDTMSIVNQQTELIKQNNPKLTLLAPLKMVADGFKGMVGNAAKEVEERRENFRLQESLLNGISSIEKGIVNVATTFGNAIKEKASKFGGGLKGILSKLLIGGALAAFVLFMNSPYWEKMKTLLQDTIAPALVGVYNNVLKPIWDVGLKSIFRLFEDIGVLFEDIGLAITDFKNGDILGGISKLIGGLGTFFMNTVDNLLTGVYNIFGKMFGLEETDSVGASIAGFFTGLKDKVVAFFTETIPTAISDAISELTNITGKVLGFFGDLYDRTVAYFTETLPAEIEKGIKFLTDFTDKVLGFFSDIYNKVTEVFGEFSVFQFVEDTIGELITSIKSIFSGDFSAENFYNLFGSLLDIVTYPVNLAINAVKDIFGFGDPEEPFRLSDFVLETFGKIGEFFKSLLDIDVRGLAESVMPATVVDFLFGKKVDQESAEFKAMDGLEQAKATGLYDHDYAGASEINRNLVKDASEKQLQAILDHDDLRDEDRDFVKRELAGRVGAGEFVGAGAPEQKRLSAYERKMQRIENKRGEMLNRSSTEAQEERAQAKQNIAIISQQQKMHPREMAMMNRGGGQVAVPVPIKDSSSAATAATSSGF